MSVSEIYDDQSIQDEVRASSGRQEDHQNESGSDNSEDPDLETQIDRDRKR